MHYMFLLKAASSDKVSAIYRIYISIKSECEAPKCYTIAVICAYADIIR